MTNDDVLVVNVAAMHQAGADIQTALGTMENQLDQLERDAGPLVATWEGEAKEAYAVRQATWRAAAGDLAGMLRDIRNALEASAVDYVATERRNTALFQ